MILNFAKVNVIKSNMFCTVIKKRIESGHIKFVVFLSQRFAHTGKSDITNYLFCEQFSFAQCYKALEEK